jgi:carbonic anhydrase/acetyltransferase-like protein (isoleucine patch superfamily)
MGSGSVASTAIGEFNVAIYQLGDWLPAVADSAWVAPGAHVIGQVRLAAHASVWFGATLRGDNELISIGARSNVQENSVLHTDEGVLLNIGEDVTIGHQAMLHGCTIGDGSLIGIQAVVLNGAVIGRGCLVGAGALVTERKVFPDGSLIIGSPARVARSLSAEERARLLESAAHYVERQALFRAQLHLKS